MLIALVASAVGEWPNGVHWTPGESRAVRVDDEDEIPSWLTKSVSVSVSVSAAADDGSAVRAENERTGVRLDGGVLPVGDVDDANSSMVSNSCDRERG